MQEMQETWVGKIPWRRKWQPTPVFLPGESHRQRSLVGYSPGGRKESDATEHAHVHAECRLSKSTLPPLRSQTIPQLQYLGDNSKLFPFFGRGPSRKARVFITSMLSPNVVTCSQRHFLVHEQDRGCLRRDEGLGGTAWSHKLLVHPP